MRRDDKEDFNFRSLVMIGIPACIAGNSCTDFNWTTLINQIFSLYVLGLFVFFLVIAYFEYKINLNVHASKYLPIDLILVITIFICVRQFGKTSDTPITSLRWWCQSLLMITVWDLYTFRKACKHGVFPKESLAIIPMLELLMDAIAQNFRVRKVTLSQEYRYWIALDGFCFLVFTGTYTTLTFLKIPMDKNFYMISQAVIGFCVVSLNSYRYSLVLHSSSHLRVKS